MNRRHFSSGLLASTGLAACQGDSARLIIGRQLPVVKGHFTDGSEIDLSAAPQPAIIRFWGLWCGPCMLDMPNWESVVRQLREGPKALPDINIFTIHVGLPPASEPDLKQWAFSQQSDVATPVVDDSTYAIMKAVKVTGTPSTLYVDTNGRISEHAWQFKNERGVNSFLRKVHKLHAKI